jgi:hypothetical protein
MAERLMARRAQREVSVDQLAQHVDAALSAGRPAVAGSIRIRTTQHPRHANAAWPSAASAR